MTHYDYGFRIYNPSIGKFLSVDPLTKDYPMLTPYQFGSNTPIQAVDLDGLESYYAADGAYIGTYLTNTEFRIISDKNLVKQATLAFNDKIKFVDEKTRNSFFGILGLITEKAYPLEYERQILKDWAKINKNNDKFERVMRIFSKEFTDECGEKFTLIMPGTTADGPTPKYGRGNISFPTESELIIDNEDYSYSWEVLTDIHSHTEGEIEKFSDQDIWTSVENKRKRYVTSTESEYIGVFDPIKFLEKKGINFSTYDIRQYIKEKKNIEKIKIDE